MPISARRARLLLALGTVLATCCLGSGCRSRGAGAVPDEPLAFLRNGRELRTASLAELATHAPPRIVTTDDPYYGHHKRFRAMSLESILVFAFGEDVAALRRHSFVLHARDGYAVPIEGHRLLEGGAYVAFDDVDTPGFAPIGPQRVSPAPAYLVWTRSGQANLETHPRPWQLVSIEIAAFETLYPHTVPTGQTAGSPAMRGFELFRARCIKCHAINREGGRVGPDLNVPQSITAYRPEAQIRAYIRNPRAFRYGAMPAHTDLTEADLDALIAYLRTMATQQHDPDANTRPVP